MRRGALLLAAAAAAAAWAAGPAPARAEGPVARRDPSVGFLYPAGGSRGTTFRVTAGGQNLAGAFDARISGDGVRVSVVRYEGGPLFLNGDQAREVRRRLAERRTALGAGTGEDAGPARPRPGRGRGGGRKEAPKKEEPVDLPNHPLLRDLEKLDLAGLDRLEARFLRPRDRRLVNVPIAETVLLEVAVDAEATPGDREVRLRTPAGLTNPIRFDVGTEPEIVLPGDLGPPLPAVPPPSPPFLLNGQLLPGTMDRFRFRAARGARLVLRVDGRALIPYLADAVPGWFQPVLSVEDAAGREVAYGDDWRFDPDPVVLFEVPEDGEYVLGIRDALWRGREDFTYRLSVAESPFVASVFPLGGRAGSDAVSFLRGWNLPGRLFPLETGPGPAIRAASVYLGDLPSNPVAYAVDDLPEGAETEPNDSAAEAMVLASTPRIVNGRISRPGDVDVFRVAGRAGDEIVAEVRARRLGSPLDSILRVSDASGKVLAWNDDVEDPEAGLLTHHADSRVRARIPGDGVCVVSVADAGGHGSEDHAYRLRIGPPRPDFAVLLAPSSLNVPAGRAAPFRVRAVRRDGFAGDIEVSLADPHAGFELSGGRIPAGRDAVSMTLALSGTAPESPVPLRLEARARIGGTTVVRPVVPAEDRMQAFAYRHLVPSRELVAAVLGPRRPGPVLRLADPGPVRVPAGGSAVARIRGFYAPLPAGVRLAAPGAPEGIGVGEVSGGPDGLAVEIRAAAALPPAPADNLLLEVLLDVSRKDAGGAARTATVSLGYLPAVPYEVGAAKEKGGDVLEHVIK